MNKTKRTIQVFGFAAILVVLGTIPLSLVEFNTDPPLNPISGSDKAFAEQLSFLENGDAYARAKALASLNELGDQYSSSNPNALTAKYVDEHLIPQLLETAEEGNSDESRAALMVLGKLIEQGAVSNETTVQRVQDFLVDLLNAQDAFPDTKSPAIMGLRHTYPLADGNVENLLVALQRERELYYKEGIARALVSAAQSNDGIRDRLHALVEDMDTDDNTKAAILSALKFDSGPPGTSNSTSILARGLQSESADVRRQAMNSMMAPDNYHNASEADVATVSALISNSSEPIRNRVLAVVLLGRMNSTRRFPDAQNLLITLTGDSSAPMEVRVRAVQSMPFAMNYSSEALDILSGLTKATEPEIVEAAERGLRVIKDWRSSLPPIGNGSGSQN